jgi:hypothetical protein
MTSYAQLAKCGAIRIEHLLPDAVLRAYAAERAGLIDNIEQLWCEGVLNGIEAPTFFDRTDLAGIKALNDNLTQLEHDVLGPHLRGSHHLHELRLRFVAPYPLGYLNWHVDHNDGPGLLYKAIIHLTDVPLTGGEFCYVPGSHHQAFSGDEEWFARRYGFRRFPGRAGSCVLFDTAGIHATGNNLGAGCRETLILTLAHW